MSADQTPLLSAHLTPMMKQWSELKTQAGSALLFFRLGDFYELFEQDALTGAPVLGVTLTTRNKSSENAAPLCGVPVSTVESYLTKALDQGFKVALAEQTELPTPEKKIVRREIVQWFTPGMRLLSSDERPHYIGAVHGSAEKWILVAADVATGHLVLQNGATLESLQDLIDRLPIEDLRVTSKEVFPVQVKYSETYSLLSLQDAERTVVESFGLSNQADAPTQDKLEIQTLGSLFEIIRLGHPKDRLRFLLPRTQPGQVWMSSATRKNLYLFEPDSKSLFKFLDQTQTALGRRHLKQVLANPTQDRSQIESRQQLIKYFRSQSILRRNFRTQLSQVNDIHRLLRRRRGPAELFQLTKSLRAGCDAAEQIDVTLPETNSFQYLSRRLNPVVDSLSQAIEWSEDSALGWIRSGINSELDELRGLQQNANRLLMELEEKLREQTQVNSLKIKFHQVFGYVAEVTALHKEKIPASAKRIQTLANSERFKTQDLEQLEEKLLSLDSRIREAERAELNRLFSLVENQQNLILDWAQSLSELDCFQALAHVSAAYHWTTPETTSSTSQILNIEDGTHPLAQQGFVPLSFDLSSEENTTQVMLLTGPNMAGKSTLLRLAATIALLHQIGSDVPAKSARLSLFDRIVCRMGAADDMTSGQSTFFVEMREVASMLHGATERSLLLFDEIGRGTSTFDGMSLAWAITETIHELGALSFMATHYLELSDLEKNLSRLRSFHLAVQEINGELKFTRRLTPGPASRSYGIQVARLAHLPDPILKRAQMKLEDFERKRAKSRPLVLQPTLHV